ncbi:MAG: glycosyltransferase family 2 protein [Verrucomicrobiota bacterium]|nr:glycosyltransferase family 2 protein [Limisphaera sp.]MDW8381537.1 glycosyltransferase family 2 protein [Verrucomicrobiota bacterium]
MAPLVSVLMPVWNEVGFIDEAIESVLQQEWPREALELIVVDGGSTDGTREKLERWAAEDARVRVLHNPRRIIPAALNMGLKAARGELVARLDGHGMWPRHYLRACVDHLGRTGGLAMVGGAWDCVGRGWMGVAIARAVSSPWGVGNARYRTLPPHAPPQPVDSVPFWVTRRQTFRRVGLFHEGFPCHEDYEFNYRLRRAGGVVLLLPGVRARYVVRPTLRQLARQYLRYGHWKGRFLATAPASIQARHVVPPLWMATGVGLLLGALFSKTWVGPALGWWALYGAGLGWATLQLSRRPRPLDWQPRSTWILPLALLLIHLSWGLGVWTGLVRGPVRNRPPAGTQGLSDGDRLLLDSAGGASA